MVRGGTHIGHDGVPLTHGTGVEEHGLPLIGNSVGPTGKRLHQHKASARTDHSRQCHLLQQALVTVACSFGRLGLLAPLGCLIHVAGHGLLVCPDFLLLEGILLSQ